MRLYVGRPALRALPDGKRVPHWCHWALAGVPAAMDPMFLTAGRVVALTGLDLMTDPEALASRLSRIRREGYAVSIAEREPDAYSVVAPVRNAEARVVAALCVSGPLYRFAEEQREEGIVGVREAAEKISRKMGFTG